MLTTEENEFITQVGPGTPMGELFRRFWMPALLSEELPGPDCTPVRVRLMGEDLIAFRDTDGKVGIVDAYCPHRSAPLFFGRNEESGLRCVYHGWKFDVNGNCVDMPNCVEGETFKAKVKIPTAEVLEGGGIIWAYMGPKDKVPPRPAFSWMDLPDNQRYVTKFTLHCNYLQILENEFAEGHATFLHSTIDGNRSNPTARISGSNLEQRQNAPRWQDPNQIPVDTHFGSMLIRKIDGDAGEDQQTYGARALLYLPSISPAGGLNSPGVYPMNLKIPVDDEHTLFYRFKWSDRPFTDKAWFEMKAGGYEFPTVIPGTYELRENKANDYLVDRVKQRFFSYTGIINTPVQDSMVVENQRGPISDRTKETLCSSDKYLIYARRRLTEAARRLMDGHEPEEPWHPEAFRFPTVGAMVTVPKETPIEEVARLLQDPEARRTAPRLQQGARVAATAATGS